MNADQYVLWFIVMAVLIATILAVGTLGAAGLIHRPVRPERVPGEVRSQGRHADVHHWYDRFTHHHHHAA